MTKLQGLILNFIIACGSAIIAAYVTDPNLRGALVLALSQLQTGLNALAYGRNPDGSPASVAYEPPDKLQKLEIR